MRIAMLTSDYLPNIGGIASHIYELSKALVDQGHEVEVWFWDRNGKKHPTEMMGSIPVRMIPQSVGRGRFGRSLRLAGTAKTFCNQFDPDVIHVHTLDPLMRAMAHVKKECRASIVWTNHTSRFLREIGSKIWRLKIKYSLKPFDGILATSLERCDKSRSLGVADDFCKYIPNGIDPVKYEAMSRPDARRALGLPDDKFILLYTGRFAPIKGVVYLAEAISLLRARIPDILCVMCGNMDGDRESDKVRSFIKANNLQEQIRLEGFVENRALGPYLFACDALVLPSLMEATSISALEAMSASRPIIGSRVGGIPDLVREGETGVLSKPGDSEDLARAIQEFHASKIKEDMGRNAREKVLKEFTWSRVAEDTAAFYSSVSRAQM